MYTGVFRRKIKACKSCYTQKPMHLFTQMMVHRGAAMRCGAWAQSSEPGRRLGSPWGIRRRSGPLVLALTLRLVSLPVWGSFPCLEQGRYLCPGSFHDPHPLGSSPPGPEWLPHLRTPVGRGGGSLQGPGDLAVCTASSPALRVDTLPWLLWISNSIFSI